MTDTQQTISHWSVGRGRGFRPAQPYKPSRRPGQPATPSPTNQQTNPKNITDNLARCSVDQNSHQSTAPREITGGVSSKGNGNGSQSSGNGNGAKSTNGKPSLAAMKSGVTQLKTKYSYKANPESPLGQKELTVKQGETLLFMGVCDDNEMWWKVAREEGEGFVPASYVEVQLLLPLILKL